MSDKEGDKIYLTIQELNDWLFERVADDRDVVLDEMQDEFFATLAQAESDNVEGSDEYKANIEAVRTTLQDLQRPGNKATVVTELKKKITDGFRPCWYSGHVDNQGRPHGEGILQYENKDSFTGTFTNGVLNRSGTFKLAKDSSVITGTWLQGLLEGEARVDMAFHEAYEGYWHQGVPHGYQRGFGPKDPKGRVTLKWVGRYLKGVRVGFWWKGLLGGGLLCGQVDKEGHFSGNDLAFIYPDLRTALRGSFYREQLVEARLCHLQGCYFDASGMARPKFSDFLQPQIYTFESPGKLNIAKHPLLRDPWENDMVCVKASRLSQGGEGLFARKRIEAHQVVCYYNGIRLKTSTFAAQNAGPSDYRIRLNADWDLDIPDEHIHLSLYRATLGHKVNHSNDPNVTWIHVEHPRFGLIRGIQSLRAIAEDEEILINYHINLGDSPMWYRKVWLRHQREFKKKSDESIIKFLNRYYDDTGKRVEIDLDDDDFEVPDPKGVANLDELDDGDEEDEDSHQNELGLAKLKNSDR